MTNDELREVVEKIEKIMNPANTKEGHETEAHKLVRKLITIAQTVIELGESCPKEKVIECKGTRDCECREQGAYNQARADMLLWVAGKLGGLEEVIAESSLCHLCLSNVDEGRKEMLDLVNSIRQLFGVKD